MIPHHWGTSETLFLDDRCQLDRAHGLEGGASSLHLHERKHNQFIVVAGCVEIWLPTRDGPESMTYRLTAGGSCWIPAGDRHRMVFAEDSDLYELYMAVPGAAIDQHDIKRFDEGRRPLGV